MFHLLMILDVWYYNDELQFSSTKETVPFAKQAYIQQVHYKIVAAFHHLHSFQSALPQVHQLLPNKYMKRTVKINMIKKEKKRQTK